MQEILWVLLIIPLSAFLIGVGLVLLGIQQERGRYNEDTEKWEVFVEGRNDEGEWREVKD